MLTPRTLVRSWKPILGLRPYVSEFSFREESIGDVQKHVPLSARSDCFLQFYFREQYRVLNVSSGAIHLAPRCVLVGPHARRREDLLCLGHLRMFTIRFSAIGFRNLFGIPASLIVDYADHADAVLGKSVRDLGDLLASTAIDQMPALSEAFLVQWLARVHPAPGSEVAGNLVSTLQRSDGTVHISHLGALYGLSVRQIERTFLEHVGLTPKVFSRLTRLKKALALGAIPGASAWTDIANAAGYFDQAHMIREFRAFNGVTPVQFEAMKRTNSIGSAELSAMSRLSNRQAQARPSLNG